MSNKLTNINNKLRYQIIRTILYGFFIWLMPALVAAFLWNTSTNESIMDMTWFNAVIGFVWSFNYAIFAFLYFKTIRDNYSKYGFIAGIIWYIMNILLDLLLVIVILNLGIEAFLPGTLVYINNFILTIMIGYLLTKKGRNE